MTKPLRCDLRPAGLFCRLGYGTRAPAGAYLARKHKSGGAPPKLRFLLTRIVSTDLYHPWLPETRALLAPFIFYFGLENVKKTSLRAESPFSVFLTQQKIVLGLYRLCALLKQQPFSADSGGALPRPLSPPLRPLPDTPSRRTPRTLPE